MSDFKKWFEANQFGPYPCIPGESRVVVFSRLMEAVAQYVDEEIDRLREEKEKQQ